MQKIVMQQNVELNLSIQKIKKNTFSKMHYHINKFTFKNCSFNYTVQFLLKHYFL